MASIWEAQSDDEIHSTRPLPLDLKSYKSGVDKTAGLKLSVEDSVGGLPKRSAESVNTTASTLSGVAYGRQG